jgi:chromosome segregation ATPase
MNLGITNDNKPLSGIESAHISNLITELTELTEKASIRFRLLKSELESSNQGLEAANEKLASKESGLEELKEENELILLQLHQVQEELEMIFFDKLESDKKAEQAITHIGQTLAENRKAWIQSIAKSKIKAAAFFGRKLISLTYV